MKRHASEMKMKKYLIILIVYIVSATADSFIQPHGYLQPRSICKKNIHHRFHSKNQQQLEHKSETNVNAPSPVIPNTSILEGSPVFVRNKLSRFISLPTLLISVLVIHKCATDVLSHYTRTTGVPYSATMVAVLGEFIKIPILLTAIATFEGPRRVLPIIKESIIDRPFLLMLPGLAYSVQNVLYFMALSRISAASYQILSQTKLLFTGYFMSGFLGQHLGAEQYLGLVLLMTGTILTQLSEVTQASLSGTGSTTSTLIGGGFTVLGAGLSALPNVYYEKVLKSDGQNQWVRNVQLTFWIWFWLVTFSVPEIYQFFNEKLVLLESTKDLSLISGIDKIVVGVMFLQGLKCLIVPATLKYADNIAYAYAKPASILLTSFVSILFSGVAPTPQFVCGAVAVVSSMWIYSQRS